MLLDAAVNTPVEYRDPVPVSVPTNAPLVTFRVPLLLMVPPFSVVTSTDVPDPSTRLPSDNVPMVLPVPDSVSDPPFIAVKYAAPPLRLTVPLLKVVNDRLPVLVRLVTPAPLNDVRVTDPELVLNERVPELVTFLSENS